MNAFQSGRDDDDDETDEMNCLSLNFGELLIIEFSRELPPDQAEYCIQRMQPYSGMDAVQVLASSSSISFCHHNNHHHYYLFLPSKLFLAIKTIFCVM